jgi:hypothetical protein
MPVAGDSSLQGAASLLREARLKLESFGLNNADTPEHLFSLRLKLESAFARYEESHSEQSQQDFVAVLREIQDLH